MDNLRVAVIGARPAIDRERPSIGYREAEKFYRNGADIVAIVRSTPEAALYTAQQLQAGLGLPKQPAYYACSDLEKMIDRKKPHAVVVATPHHTHYDIIRRVLQHRKTAHVFAEKPLCWSGLPERDFQNARELFEMADGRRKILYVNTQLVSTFDSYITLHPLGAMMHAGLQNPEFKFRLVTQGNGNDSTGQYVAMNLLPHALSFLARMGPAGSIEQGTLQRHYADSSAIFDFSYNTKHRIIPIHIDLGRGSPEFEFGFGAESVSRKSIGEVGGTPPPAGIDLEYYLVDPNGELKIGVRNTLQIAVQKFCEAIAGERKKLLVSREEALAVVRLQSQITS